MFFCFFFKDKVTIEAMPFMIVMKDGLCQITAGLQVSANFSSVSSNDLNLQIEQIKLELIFTADSRSNGFNSHQYSDTKPHSDFNFLTFLCFFY